MGKKKRCEAIVKEEKDEGMVFGSPPVPLGVEGSEDRNGEGSGDGRGLELSEELAELPLEELLALRDSLGSKLFHKAAFRDDEDQPSSSSSVRKEFKRDNRRRPQEISAKKPVAKYREVVRVGRKEKWDPRFDDRCEFDEAAFQRQYGFLKDLQTAEIAQLRVESKTTTDPRRKKEIKDILLRQKNKAASEAEKAEKKARLGALRKANEARLAEGKAPVFQPRAKLRQAEMEERFERLRKSGKLDKYLKRKAKKVAKKKPRMDDVPFDDDE